MIFAQVGPRCRLTQCNAGFQCEETCSKLEGYECTGKFANIEHKYYKDKYNL